MPLKCKSLDTKPKGHTIVCLQVVPRMIAENSGLNATEVIGQLKAAHAKGQSQAGLDIESRNPGDLSEQGLVDLFNAKVSFILLRWLYQVT